MLKVKGTWATENALCAMRKWGLALMMMACIGCFPATSVAAVRTITIQGMLASGIDTSGVFIGKNADLAGQPFSLEYIIDSSRAPLVFIPPGGPFTGSDLTGEGPTTAVSPVTAFLTVNGHTYGFNTHAVNDVVSRATRQTTQVGQGLENEAFGINESYVGGGLSGIGQLGTSISYSPGCLTSIDVTVPATCSPTGGPSGSFVFGHSTAESASGSFLTGSVRDMPEPNSSVMLIAALGVVSAMAARKARS